MQLYSICHASDKMATKGAKIVKSMKNVVEGVKHPPYFKTNIPAGKAIAAPPLGPQLGQVCSMLSGLQMIKSMS